MSPGITILTFVGSCLLDFWILLSGWLSGRWVGWLEWSEHRPRHTKFYFTLSYPNLHFPTNFHQDRTKIAKVSYRGGCRVGG